jgi:hypothetical protein
MPLLCGFDIIGGIAQLAVLCTEDRHTLGSQCSMNKQRRSVTDGPARQSSELD